MLRVKGQKLVVVARSRKNPARPFIALGGSLSHTHGKTKQTGNVKYRFPKAL